MRTVLSRPEYQVWQKWKWNQALGIHRGHPSRYWLRSLEIKHPTVPVLQAPLHLSSHISIFINWFVINGVYGTWWSLLFNSYRWNDKCQQYFKITEYVIISLIRLSFFLIQLFKACSTLANYGLVTMSHFIALIIVWSIVCPRVLSSTWRLNERLSNQSWG